MPDANISGASLTDFLQQLADGVAGGCLHVGSGPQASKIFLRGGQVYAVVVPGRRADLGTRLITSGVLGPETLAEVTETQRTVFPTWSVPDLLVHHGHVERALIDAVVTEQLRQAMTELLGWGLKTWRFRVDERTREHVAPPLTVAGLLADVERRRVTWQTIELAIGGPDAVLFPAVAAVDPVDLALHPGASALLALVDGTLTVAELGHRCGFTLFEVGQVVFALLQVRLVRLSAAAPAPPVPPLDPPAVSVVSGPLTRAFHALTALLGPAPTGDDLFAVPVRLQGAPTVGTAKRRAAEALATEAERAAEALAVEAREADRLAAETLAAEVLVAAEHREAERLETARLVAERLETARLEAARTAETERLAVEAARLAVEQERARLEAERVQAERVQAERQEIERVALGARLAAEAAEEIRNAQAALEQADAQRQAADRRAADDQAAVRREQEAGDAAALQAVEEDRLAVLVEAGRTDPVSPEAHAAVFAELRAAAEGSAPAPATRTTTAVTSTATLEAETRVEPPPADASPEPYRPSDTDTASLLRELSSLGLDEDEAPPSKPAAPRAGAATAAAAAAAKKRKGRFGRS